VKDLCRQLPDLGRLAYPMRGEATNRAVLNRAVLGRKRHGRPEHAINRMLSGGNDPGGSKLGKIDRNGTLSPISEPARTITIQDSRARQVRQRPVWTRSRQLAENAANAANAENRNP
jgi:hypothetical protein